MSHPNFSESEQPSARTGYRTSDVTPQEKSREPFQHNLEPLNPEQEKTRAMIIDALVRENKEEARMLAMSFNQTYFHDVSKETRVSIDGLTEGPVDKHGKTELWLRRTKQTADFRFVTRNR